MEFPGGLQQGDVLEVIFYATMGNQTSMNVRRYEVSSAPIPDIQMEFLSQLMGEYHETEYSAMMAQEAIYRGTSIRRIEPTRTIEILSLRSAPGTVASEALPAQVAGLITFLTPLPGAAGRNRAYIPFPAEGDNGENTPTVGYIGRLTTLANLMAETVTLISVATEQAILEPLIYPGPEGVHQFVAGVRANEKWATQRRRGNYGSPNNLPGGNV